MSEHIIEEKDLEVIGRELLSGLEGGRKQRATVVLLHGDLGSGKTTFTKSLATLLGIEDDVHSPTFILKKEYNTKHDAYKKLIHIDAYRFNDPKESQVLRLKEDLVDPNTLMVIEWPSKMAYVQPDVNMFFDVVDDDTRKIRVEHENK